MRFKELATGAYIFAALTGKDYQSGYQEAVNDARFLGKLRTAPSVDDLQRLIAVLKHHGVSYLPLNMADEYLSVWPKLKRRLDKLAGEDIETCDFHDSRVVRNIKSAAFYLQWPSMMGDDMLASKVLHFFNPSLFVMWDKDVATDLSGPIGPRGYLEFLRDRQLHAREINADFKSLSLPGTPAEFLSQKLCYQGVRPLTRLLSDCNWVNIKSSNHRWLAAIRKCRQELPGWITRL
ncbi:hypothetical protein ES708_14942 [subsurface metagenome]